MRGDVSIIGFGMIEFGELFEKGYGQMLSGAFEAAFEDVTHDIDIDDIEAAWLGTNRGSLSLDSETVTGSRVAEYLGLGPIPVTRVENACATGSDAFRNAVMAVKSGTYDIVLVAGIEKMRDKRTAELLDKVAAISYVSDTKGMTAPGLFALYARRHMHEFGTTREQMAEVSVKNHRHGMLCEYSHHQFELTVDDVLDAPTVSSPFGLYDCAPQTDGAAVLLLADTDIADQYAEQPVSVLGTGQASTSFNMEPRPNYVGAEATKAAAKEAYEMADIGPDEVDVVEQHDCFTFTEIMNYEDLGFAQKGEGATLLKDGVTTLDGEMPVNPSGGLLSKGHPLGATGVAQLCELVTQLRHEAGDRQAPDANIGLQHNIGGPLSTSCVNILANR